MVLACQMTYSLLDILLQLGRRRWATDGTRAWDVFALVIPTLQLGRRRWATDGWKLYNRNLVDYEWASIGPSPLGDGWTLCPGCSKGQLVSLQLGRRRWATDGFTPPLQDK